MKEIGKCEFSNLKIYSSSDWLDMNLTSNYSGSITLIGKNIINVVPKGYPSLEGVQKLLTLRKEFLMELGLWEKEHYEIKNYGHIGNIPPKNSRILFTNYMIEENNRGYLKGFWGYNAPPPVRWIFNIGNHLYNPGMTIEMLKDYKAAVTRAAALSLTSGEKREHDITKKLYSQSDIDEHIDGLLTFMESTTWYESDLEVKTVTEDHPFKVLYDVLSIIKMDFNNILEKERKSYGLLNENREKYRILTDNLKDFVFTTDFNFELLSAAGDSFHTLGYTLEELWALEKTGGTKIIHPLSMDLVKDQVKTTLETKESTSFEIRVIHKNQKFYWVRCTLSPLLDDKNEVVGIHGLLHNIDEQKKNEEKLTSIQHQLMETALVAGKSQLATGLLHDIANILNGVNISLDMLTAYNENSEITNLLQANALLEQHSHDYGEFFTQDKKGKILPSYYISLGTNLEKEHVKREQEINALKNKVNSIRDIISTQQKYAKNTSPEELVHIPGVLEDAITLQQNVLKKYGIILVKAYSYSQKINVVGNKSKLIHVMINLIKNAGEAMDQSKNRSLIIELEAIDQQAVIRVKDYGPGIPEGNFEVIFKYGVTMKKDGHGFGLNICHNYITEMKGKIYARNWEEGAIFFIELPLAGKKQDLL